MSVSLFDLFKIGIGPSSSHTVGPMYAANQFVQYLQEKDILNKCANIHIQLYGSLALTGDGHGTLPAILNGLEGCTPQSVTPENVVLHATAIIDAQEILLNNTKPVRFTKEKDLQLFRKSLAYHANGMRFIVFDASGDTLLQKTYYSIGGGFLVDDDEKNHSLDKDTTSITYPFASAQELLALCHENNLSISALMLENEKAWHNEQAIRQKILTIYKVMLESIRQGSTSDQKTLPGILKVKRRAPHIYEQLKVQKIPHDSFDTFNWLNLYALAVNEENAAGGRIVTAPTNGAAGIIPSVLHHYMETHQGNDDDVCTFLLTAAAIAILYKKNASISAAEVGCQGEVGVACSMAAAGLTAVLGGSVKQIENAAEMGMEHHLGLTCDPIAGLVQIPCIERNAMGAVQAVNTAKLALLEDGQHIVSLDDVIKTMFETGKDMQTRYKETAEGGLAATVNITEC